MTITAWPLADRPREKLLIHGPTSLSDTELLAIFLRCGASGKTAIDLARELLQEFGSLKKLLAASPAQCCQKLGMGKAKYAMLKAAVELGKRYHDQPLPSGELLINSYVTKRFLLSRLSAYEHEVFACIYLDSRQRVLAFEELFHGTLNEANVYPRELVKRALQHNAANLILAHNHPSGDPTPSQSDQELTLNLKQALALVNIRVIDHIVVGAKTCISFIEMGLMV